MNFVSVIAILVVYFRV